MLDLSIYLDISDDVKFAWKIQRDMQERGWTEEAVRASIEGRKPGMKFFFFFFWNLINPPPPRNSDFEAFVAPQRALADIVIEVLPTQLVDDKEVIVIQYNII
jgi:phosphoribulokinase